MGLFNEQKNMKIKQVIRTISLKSVKSFARTIEEASDDPDMAK